MSEKKLTDELISFIDKWKNKQGNPIMVRHKVQALQIHLPRSRDILRNAGKRTTVPSGTGACGIASGAEAAYKQFEKKITARGPDTDLKPAGGPGLCYAEPTVEIKTTYLKSTGYGKVDAAFAERIVTEHLEAGNTLTVHIYENPAADLFDDNGNPFNLTRLCESKGQESGRVLLENPGPTITSTAMCGPGQTAANPVLSTIRYFRVEYDEHIHEKKCCAHVCATLEEYHIKNKCAGGTACAQVCPASCIPGDKKNLHVIDQDKCIKSGRCFSVCRFGAVVID
jgi:(2Fe-2S) ferredoxin/ferredoxin